MTATVSIIIPTYNRAELLGEAVQSALAQTYAAREILVVDDGSTDQTPAAAASFGAEIRYLQQANAGVETARNAGVAAATGEYLYFLDSDDVLRPRAVERLVAVLEAHPSAGMVYGTAEEFDLSGHLMRLITPPYSRPPGVWPGAEELAHLLLRSYIQTGALLARRSVFEAVGGFRPVFGGMAEDWDLYARMAGAADVGYIPDLLAIVRHQPGGLTTRMDVARAELYLSHFLRIHETALATPGGQALSPSARARADAFALYKRAHIAYAL
ncbi:MAG TPA: glycosyltransferase family A protein, partial [Ktedonobacterales bacterium]